MITITGCPRSGTKYLSELFKLNGFDVGHESLGKDGTVNWCLAGNSKNPLYGEPCNGPLITVVRNPYDCIPSICGIRGKAWRWIYNSIPELKGLPLLERAQKFWVMWTAMAISNSYYYFKIEEIENEFPILCEKSGLEFGGIVRYDLPKTINSRPQFQKPKIKLDGTVLAYAWTLGYDVL